MERNYWEKKGREDGRNGVPSADQSRSEAELQIERNYEEKMDNARKEYEKEITRLDERIDRSLLVNVTSSETSVQVERALQHEDDSYSDITTAHHSTKLKHIVSEKETEFRRLQKDTQDAIDSVNHFKKTHSLVRTANIPESRTWSWGLLVAVVVLETIVNGVFFGEHVAGSIFQGISIALLASVINVLVLGSLIAYSWRQKNHKDDWQKVLSLSLLAFLIVCSLLVNVFVAHYRDALPTDQPVASHECRLGNDERIASGEAWCLLRNELFNLDGFMSYMLLIIGLAACGFGAWEFYRMTDSYPGYGRRERKRKEMIREMENSKKNALEELKRTWDSSHDELLSEHKEDNPFVNWQRSDGAIRNRIKRHEDHKKEIAVLEKRCSSDIEIYRAANRSERRGQPYPPEWDEPWKADWPPLEELNSLQLCPLSQAEALRTKESKKVKEQLSIITACFEECKKDIAYITRLEHERNV